MDYWLGGKDNFAADRELAERRRSWRAWPESRAAPDPRAHTAGMRLGERCGDRTREPFTGESGKHVSAGAKPAG
jgi:S-adenosyl methyltransferase